jgi:competence protein ComEC
MQCLKLTPESLYAQIYSALICGKNLSATPLTQNLKNLGIYHVIIVSGSHLIFLSVLIEKIFFSPRLEKLKLISFPLLLFYALATGAQPPVIRALVSIVMDKIQKKNKLFWNQNEVTFVSLLICLTLFDPWKSSYSLLLSYVASVILSLASKKNQLLKNIWIYILILPFLLPLAAPHPLSFLSNMILSPILGAVLFPLSFVAFLVPHFNLLIDPLWKVFLFVCGVLGSELQSLDAVAVPLSTLWIIALILNFFGIYREKKYFYDPS